MYNDTWLAIWCKNHMDSFRAIQYDTIQWLEIDIVVEGFLVKNKGKENAYFYAVVEEVKHWKSLTHWTTQTFSAKTQCNLYGPQTRTENLSCFVLLVLPCHDLPLSEVMLLTQSVCPGNVEWTGETFTTIKCEKHIHITIDILITRQ